MGDTLAGGGREPGLLGIYLNDHLAGATGAAELARRAAGSPPSRAAGETLAWFAREAAEDRAALIGIMGALGVPVRRYKVYAAWVAEKAGRLKPNGYLRQRSPLSSLVELEALRLGVEGKAALWRSLGVVAGHDPRVSHDQLDDLLARAGRQVQALEELRAGTAAAVFGRAGAPAQREAPTPAPSTGPAD